MGFHVAEPGADNNFNSAWTLEMQKLMVKVGLQGRRPFEGFGLEVGSAR